MDMVLEDLPALANAVHPILFAERAAEGKQLHDDREKRLTAFANSTLEPSIGKDLPKRRIRSVSIHVGEEEKKKVDAVGGDATMPAVAGKDLAQMVREILLSLNEQGVIGGNVRPHESSRAAPASSGAP